MRNLNVPALIASALLIFGVHAGAQPGSHAAQMLAHDDSPKTLREAAERALPGVGQSLKTDQTADGPAISRLVAMSSEPIFKLIRHPRAKPGQKVVVIELPKNAKGEIQVDGMQVAIKFSVVRETDSCNYYSLQGQVKERAVPGADFLNYFEMSPKLGPISSTFMGCMNDQRLTRPLEITTELQGLRRFRDNLVFFVPEEVSVEAQIWRPTEKLVGTVVP